MSKADEGRGFFEVSGTLEIVGITLVTVSSIDNLILLAQRGWILDYIAVFSILGIIVGTVLIGINRFLIWNWRRRTRRELFGKETRRSSSYEKRT